MLFANTSYGQIGDCIGAQYVCQNTYNYPAASLSNGNILPVNEFPNPAIDPGGIACTGGISPTAYWNSVSGQVWFYFKASTSGTICLSINPILTTEDFDWMIFQMNGMNCTDVFNGNAPIVSCNVSGQTGSSGPNNQPGPQNEPCLTVNQGDEFLMCVNFFVAPGAPVNTDGFSLTIDPSSTSNIFDTQAPQFISMQSPVNCSEDTIQIQFSESVLCNTVVPGNLQIMDASGNLHTITDAFSTNCLSGVFNVSDVFNVVIPAGLPSGNYTFTITGNVTDFCGNTAQGDFLPFVVNSPLVIGQTLTSSVCTANNGSVVLTPQFGASPYIYNWSNGLPATSTQNNLAPGTYYVTVTDQVACSKIESVTIALTSPTLTPNIATNNAICTTSNGSATINSVSGGTTPYSYQWSNGLGTTNTTGPVASSNYTVTITDNNGCSLVQAVNIGNTNTVLNTNNTINNATCTSGDGSISISVLNGTSPYTYQWAGVSPNPGNVNALNAVDSGIYGLTVTDVYGCQSTQNVSVGANNVNISIVSNQSDPICLTANGSIDINPSNGTAPYNYQWSDPLLIGANLSNLDIGTYAVTVTDADGCIKTATYTLAADFSNTPQLLLVNKSNTSCSYTSDGSAEVVSNVGGYGGNIYLWSDGTMGPVIQNLASGAYQAIVSDIYGCTDTLNVNITSPTPIYMDPLSDTTICQGGTVTLTASAQGGTPSMNFAWLAGVITGGATITDNPVVPTTYEVTAVDGNGCRAEDTVSATVDFFPGITTVMPLASGVCQGLSTTVSVQASGGNGLFNYLWNTGGTSSSVIVSPNVTTTYYVTVSNGAGCANTPVVDSIKVVVAHTPTVQFTSNKAEGCVPQEVDFLIPNYNPSYQYQWYYGDGNSELFAGNNPSHDYQIAGCMDVTLQVTSDSGCVSSLSNTCMIKVYDLPVVNFSYTPGNPTNLSPEVTFTDYTDNAIAWFWNIEGTQFFNTESFRYEFENAGSYDVTLEVEDIHGCRDTLTKEVVVEYQTVVFLPNTFTPNADELNDSYGPIGEGISTQGFEFRIINRWGQQVFYSETLQNKWDGTFNNQGGEICQDGVYTYVLTYRNYVGTKKQINGQVTLLNLTN